MHLPQAFINSLQGLKGFDEELFVKAHDVDEKITSVRFNQQKIGTNKESSFFNNITLSPVPWCKTGFYLSDRPSFTFDPLFHAGCYYVQEASSMFLEQALHQTINLNTPQKILDLCAAPGGKSTLIQSLMSKDSLLVTNDVIRSRANILKDNIIKWGCENVVVTNNDPKDFNRLEGFFDVLVVDAPCSGSGLFRREADAIGEWSTHNVTLCSQRQQRILANALPALKEEGILIYSTCSYSIAEDEQIADWLVKDFNLESIQLTVQPQWNIVEIETNHKNFGYRFWPHHLKGEGFFISVFRKKEGSTVKLNNASNSLEVLTKKEQQTLHNWTNSVDKIFLKYKDTVYAWPQQQLYDFSVMLKNLKVIYSGVLAGTLVHDKLIPAHSLALSNIMGEKVLRSAIDLNNAIAYLQRKDFQLTGTNKGWMLATYQNHPLGWMNVLPTRINNYYPKELRILKERN